MNSDQGGDWHPDGQVGDFEAMPSALPAAIADNAIALIGETPLVRLDRLVREVRLEAEILIKLEYLNPFASTKDRVARAMIEAGLAPQVRYRDNMRAYVHRGDDDYFVFFFSFDLEGRHDKWIEFYGQRVDLQLGSKTSGVLRIRGGRLVSYLVKGENEVEGVQDEIRIEYKDQVIQRRGDFSSRDE